MFARMKERKPYSCDVSDEEWNFVAPYVALMTERVPWCQYTLRELFNALCWLVRCGGCYRMFCVRGRRSINQCDSGWRGDISEASVHDLRQSYGLGVDRAWLCCGVGWTHSAIWAARAGRLAGYSARKAARFIRQSIPWAFASYSWATANQQNVLRFSRWYRQFSSTSHGPEGESRLRVQSYSGQAAAQAGCLPKTLAGSLFFVFSILYLFMLLIYCLSLKVRNTL